MIFTPTSFWKAFFDPKNPDHKKARVSVKLYDRDKIILSGHVLAEVVDWLHSMKKPKNADWFLDYTRNTKNVKVVHLNASDAGIIERLCIGEDLSYSDAACRFFEEQLGCEIAKGF